MRRVVRDHREDNSYTMVLRSLYHQLLSYLSIHPTIQLRDKKRKEGRKERKGVYTHLNTDGENQRHHSNSESFGRYLMNTLREPQPHEEGSPQYHAAQSSLPRFFDRLYNNYYYYCQQDRQQYPRVLLSTIRLLWTKGSLIGGDGILNRMDILSRGTFCNS